MKTKTRLGLTLVLGLLLGWGARGAAPPARLTAAQQAQMVERYRWMQRANTHYRAGEVDEAIAAIQEGLALERSVFGGVRIVSLPSLASLANLQEQREQFSEAVVARQELLRRREELHGRGDWRVTDARLELEDTCRLARLDMKQRQRLRQAQQWNMRVFQLWQQGRSKDALPFAEKALAARREILGEKHRATAQSWFNLGAQHEKLARCADAERCYRCALEIYKEVLGEKHPDYAQSLNNLALLYKDMGEHRRALPLLQKALRIVKEVQGEKHPAYAQSLNNLAVLYKDMGEHRRALPLLQKALRITKEVQGEKHPHYPSSLNNLAVLYKDMGEHRDALPLLQQALRIRKEVWGEKHHDYALSLNNLASLYEAMGEHRQGLPLYQQALRIFKEVLGEKHPSYATSLNNLAGLYQAMGEYRQALPLFQQALRINKEVQGDKHAAYALSLNNLALLYQNMGEHRQALPLFQQALRIHKEVLGDKHPHYATSLNNLAVLYKEMGKQGASLMLAGQALAVSQAHVLNSLSVLSDRQRQHLLHQQASYLELFLSGAIGNVPSSVLYEQVAAFKDVTAAAIAEQRLARHLAEKQPALGRVLDELRDVRSQLARLDRQVPSARDLARWRQRFDELDQRKTDLEQQLARASTDFAQLREKPTAARVAARLPAGTALVEFLTYLHRLRPAAGGRWFWERRLLAFVVRADRAPVLLELGNADRIHGAVRLWRQSVSAGESPDALAASLLRKDLWQPIAKHLAGIESVLIAPDGELACLPFAALSGDKPGSFLLEKYTFDYLSSGRQLLLPSPTVKGEGLLVLGGATFGHPRETSDPLQRPTSWPPLPGTELESRQVEAAFRTNRSGETIRTLSGGRADRVRLLAALEPGRVGRHWRYLHLATHGHFDPPPYGLPPAVLGVWSVGAAAGPGLAGLSGSLTAALTAQEPGVLNEERGFDPTGRQHRVAEGNPMLLCSLVLAGVNDTGEAGYLSAEEIALLDLEGCELAVLSACETGLGRQAGWQGVQGLQRGFHQAGARHVLASLWSVSDPATSVLMEEFYDQLWRQKKKPAEALRLAQLAVLKEPSRVRKRALELRALLAKRGVSEAELEQRGILVKSRKRPPQPGASSEERSPVAWWAAFVLSGRP